MTDLTNQKRISAALLKCGVHRVWFDPERSTDIQNAISREDLRGLISEGVIKAEQKKGVSRGRARLLEAKRSYGHCKGPGRRKGAAGARHPRKYMWMQKIRAIRKSLRELRATEAVDTHMYRLLYRKAAGGQFRSVAHLKAQLEIMTGRLK
jgi:large subunit ribosomal protein L19e